MTLPELSHSCFDDQLSPIIVPSLLRAAQQGNLLGRSIVLTEYARVSFECHSVDAPASDTKLPKSSQPKRIRATLNASNESGITSSIEFGTMMEVWIPGGI